MPVHTVVHPSPVSLHLHILRYAPLLSDIMLCPAPLEAIRHRRLELSTAAVQRGKRISGPHSEACWAARKSEHQALGVRKKGRVPWKTSSPCPYHGCVCVCTMIPHVGVDNSNHHHQYLKITNYSTGPTHLLTKLTVFGKHQCLSSCFVGCVLHDAACFPPKSY